MVFKVSVQSPILNIGTQVDIVVTFKVLVSGAIYLDLVETAALGGTTNTWEK